MKKERNCSNPYPIYPPYQPMMGYMQPQYMMQDQNSDQISNLQQQINKLERRVSNLENMYNNNISYSNTNYNSSNYQMM